ncbi:Kinesin light chain 3 [Entophlyctis sp. JEL0112]|nr:Kinesin light chain 3 [Entophlyctis sp. JEL0112]
MFTNSQHNTGDRPFEWWTTTFMQAVGKIKNVVMVTIPWESPVTLKRAWCCFEVYAAKRTDAQFHVAMTRADLTKFAAHAAGFSNSKQAFLRSLFVVDFAKAEATNPQDLKHIFDVVNEHLGTGGKGGTAKLNRLVKSAVTLWMVNALNVLMQATADKVQMAGFCEFQARLLVSNGNLVEAIPVLEKGLPLIQARYGPFSSNALSALSLMGNAYSLHGQVAKSDAVFQYWLANASQTFGPASKQALSIKCSWGSALVSCHEYKRSESLLTEAFSAAHQNFGSIDSVTLQANINLGMLYLCLERVDEAIPRFIQMRKVENVAKNIVKGMSKISLLDKRVAEEAKATVNAGTFSEGLIAFGQFLKGQYSTALPVLQDWLFVAATMHGESLMFAARAALGFCHFYLGNMKEAIDILADETALESSWTAHFYDVPIAYACVLQKIGRAEEALAILQEPMTKPKRVSVLRFMILMKQTLCLVYNDLHKYQKFQAAFLELDSALIDVYGNGAKRQEYLQPVIALLPLTAQQPLPPGWVWQFSNDGKLFFVNTSTGVAQWTHPSHAAPDVQYMPPPR